MQFLGRKLSLVLLFLVFWVKTQGQNLVPNPSFEQIQDCDLYFDGFPKAKNWRGYNFTPDLFNICAQSPYLGVPNNVFDRQIPFAGNGYAGILTYHWEYPNELIGAKLIQPLKKGEKYEVNFKISRAESHAQYATNNIGLLFTNEPEKAYNCQKVHINMNEVVAESEVWVMVKGVFLADADYEYLVIGNFFTRSQTKLQRMKGGAFEAAYYFIDDVYVAKAKDDAQVTVSEAITQKVVVNPNPPKKETPAKPKEELTIAIAGKVMDADTKQPLVALVEFIVPNSTQKQEYETDYITGQYAFANIKTPEKFIIRLSARNYYPQVTSFFSPNAQRIQKDFYLYPLRAGQSIELSHVNFKANEDEILPESYDELNRVLEILNDNPKMRIELSGYTDNPSHINLAQRRALAIKTHFEKVGKIDPRRLTYRAYHQTQPARHAGGAADEPNKVERVEFKILN
jgi:outer membrane protein OmpA-like peptidoglycan-associated protein